MFHVFHAKARWAVAIIMLLANASGLVQAQSDNCTTATVVGIGSHSGDTSAATNKAHEGFFLFPLDLDARRRLDDLVHRSVCGQPHGQLSAIGDGVQFSL